MTHELQNFLILVCLLVSYPIMPTLAWQERDKHPTLAIIVIALLVFVVPVFVIGFSSTLWAGASRIMRLLARPSLMSRVLKHFASATLRVGTFNAGGWRLSVWLVEGFAQNQKSEGARSNTCSRWNGFRKEPCRA